MKSKVTQIKPKMVSGASRPEFQPRFSPEGFEIMLNLLCEKSVAAIREREAAAKRKAS